MFLAYLDIASMWLFRAGGGLKLPLTLERLGRLKTAVNFLFLSTIQTSAGQDCHITIISFFVIYNTTAGAGQGCHIAVAFRNL